MNNQDKWKHEQAVQNSGPFLGKFRCKRCDLSWTKSDTMPGISQRCSECRRELLPDVQLTPYQGNRRRYGGYRCNSCNNTWSSAYSWANMYQQCKKCNKHVYPRTQDKLRWSGGEENSNSAPHQEHLCGKCQELGRSCKTLQVHDDDNDDASTVISHDDDRDDYPDDRDDYPNYDDDYQNYDDDDNYQNLQDYLDNLHIN